MVLFGWFFGGAVVYRGRPEVHKRLMLLASVALMFAGAGRLWFLGEPTNLPALAVDSFRVAKEALVGLEKK